MYDLVHDLVHTLHSSGHLSHALPALTSMEVVKCSPFTQFSVALISCQHMRCLLSSYASNSVLPAHPGLEGVTCSCWETLFCTH